MRVVRIALAAGVRWNIKRNDSKSIPLRFLEGAVLVNPLVTVQVGKDPLVVSLGDDEWHVITDGITFVLPDELESDGLPDRLGPFIRALRVASRQASLLDRVVTSFSYSISRLPSRVELAPHFSLGKLFGSYRIKTALTFDVVRKVARQTVLADYQLYDEILLDAINAHESGDYRQAILYAAIAMESLASNVLEQKYLDVLGKSKPPSHVNVLTSCSSDGQVRKDPIYRELSRSGSFTRLLHEAPLYLLRRSMLDEDQALYQSCSRLYGQRNRLGHGKARKPEDISLDNAGSLEALTIAIDAFRWFGIDGFNVPVIDEVPFGEVIESTDFL
jgi:hypothetical protein